MRKASLITGIIASSIVSFGLLLKLAGIPGGSFLALVGTVIFLVVFLPLLTVYKLKTVGATIGKVGTIIGLIAGWLSGIGLLAAVLHWGAGGILFWMAGSGLTLVFVILYLLFLFGKNAPQKKFGIFDVLILVPLVLFYLGRGKAGKDEAEINLKKGVYVTERNTERALEIGNEELYRSIVLDSLSEYERTSLERFEESTAKLLQFLDDSRCEVTALSFGIDTRACDTMQPQFFPYTNDYDTPTHYFVGVDPANPTGKGVEIQRELMLYWERTHLENVKLDLDLSREIFNPENQHAEPWVRHHFYHKKMIDAVTTITKFEIAVLRAEKQVLEQAKNK